MKFTKPLIMTTIIATICLSLALFISPIGMAQDFNPIPEEGRSLDSSNESQLENQYKTKNENIFQEKFKKVEDSIPGNYIVVFKDELFDKSNNDSEFERANKQAYKEQFISDLSEQLVNSVGGKIEHKYAYALNGFSVWMSEADALALSDDPRVDYVSEVGVVSADQTQTQINPPSWGLDRIDQKQLPVDSSYSYSLADRGVSVYIIDTGIRTAHTDFGGRAVIGADFVGDGQNGQDCDGHGTHVAGTVGGNSFGVAKNSALIAVRVLDCNGSGTTATVIAGINWVIRDVTNNPTRLPAIINMSLGGPASSAEDLAVINAINTGIHVVVAAGNDNVDASTVSPARVAEAITVGATDRTDTRPTTWGCRTGPSICGSNFGSVVDIFAPGVFITSASNTDINGNGVFDDSIIFSGTSMAAPHVAGQVAIFLQSNRNLTTAEVQNIITSNATLNTVVNPGTNSPNRLLFNGFTRGCTFSISPNNRSVTAANGNGSIDVLTTQLCSWTATSDSSWLRVNNKSGLGNGTVDYSFDVNSTPSSRTGTITVAGQIFIVTQAVNSNCAATQISFGQTVNGTLEGSSCTNAANLAIKNYTFVGTAGQQIAIAMNATTTGFDTYLELYNGTELVTYNDDSGGSRNSRIPASNGYFTLPSTASYTIVARGYNGAAIGSYTLNLQSVYSISGQVTTNNTGLSGVSVALSGSTSAAATTDADGNYSFANLAPGGSFTVTASMNGINFNPSSQTFNNLQTNQTAYFQNGALLCAPPPSGLVAWYKGEGNANDSSSNGRDGTFQNGAGFRTGKVGQAFSFDGVNDYIQLPGTFGGGAELTAVAWVKTAATSNNFQAVVSPTTTEFVHLQLAEPALNGNIVVYASPRAVVFPEITQSPTGEWRQVAISVKSGDSKLYVNGNVSASSATELSTITTTSNLRIGSGFAGGRNFNGLIDEVQIYNRALSASEIQSNYQSGSAGVCTTNIAQTASGTNVNSAPTNNVNLTFSNVTQAGNTVATPLTQSQLPALPASYSLPTPLQAYDIRTSAGYSGSITATFNVPNIADSATCARLRSLHYENGAWTTNTNATPIYNAGVCTVSQTVTSLSPFVVALQSAYSIAGRITSDGTSALSGIVVNLSGGASTMTNATGDYSFNNLTAGADYTVTPVNTALYSFTAQTATNLQANQTVNFTGTVNCSYSINPTVGNLGSAASSANSVTVTTNASGCAWTAVSNNSWISVTAGASGTGNNTVTYSVAANTGAARTGTITIAGQTFTVNQAAGIPSYEADVAPRPNGNGSIDISDVQQVLRFQSGADTNYQSNEFQRADCAPRSTSGDGVININDVQQALRYQSGADTRQTVGGSSAAGQLAALFSGFELLGGKLAAPSVNTVVKAVGGSAAGGQTVTVQILVDAQGTETGFGFSLNFNSQLLTFNSAVLGADASGSFLSVNRNNAANGQIGIGIVRDTPVAMGSNKQILIVTFTIAAGAAAGTTPITFGNTPAQESVSDANANPVTATFQDGAVTITRNAPTAASVGVGGRVTTTSGKGIRNISVTMTDEGGQIRTATTTSFGYYQFDAVQAGETYILSASGKHYTFSQPVQVLNINEEVTEVNFIANSEKRLIAF